MESDIFSGSDPFKDLENVFDNIDVNEDSFSDVDFNLDIKDIDENKSGVVVKSALKSKSLTLNNIKKQFAKIKRIEEITDFPKKGEEIEILTWAQFPSSVFVYYAIEKFGKIDDLILVSFSISKEVMRSLFQLKKDKSIGNMTLFLSDHIAGWRVDTLRELIFLAEDTDSLVRLTRSHAKISLIRVKNDYYVVTGSGNLSHNTKMEQYNFRNIKKAYDFYRDTFTETFKDERWDAVKNLQRVVERANNG